jgi:hypothetical protein
MENLVSFVQNQIDAAWNSHDMNRILECFDDNSVITFLPPVSGLPSTARGKEEIRKLVETLLPGFHVESSNIKVHGDRVTWFSRISSDGFRTMGIDSVESNTTATIRNYKVVTFTPSFTQESLTKLQAATQRMSSPGHQPGVNRNQRSTR